MSQSQPAGGGQQRTHGWVRPYAVPTDLAGLRGPNDGVVRLPLSVYSSGGGPDRGFDLAEDAQRIELYQVVLTGGTVQDQNRYLDAGQLRRLWPRLWLPAALRAAWEPLLAAGPPPSAAGAAR